MSTSLAPNTVSVPASVTQPGRAASPRWTAILFVLVLATVVWTPLAFGAVEPWAVGLIRLTACALAIVWAVGCASSGSFVASRSMLQLPLYGAAAYALVQATSFFGRAPISVDPFSSRQSALTLLALAVVFSAALLAFDRTERLERTAWTLFLLGFGVSLFAIVQYLSGATSLYWVRATPITNFFGPFVNKNHFAGLVEILLPAGLGLLATGAVPRERRVLVGFASVVMLVAVVLSRSRAGMMCVALEVVMLGLWVVWQRGRSERRVAAFQLGIAGLVLAASVVAAIVWLGSEPVTKNLAELPGQAAATDATSRLAIWRATVALVGQHPVLGSGIGAYGTAIIPIYGATDRVLLLFAHDDYLQVAADAGLVGLGLALLFVVSLGRAAKAALAAPSASVRGVAIGAVVGCIGLLLHSLVDFNLQIPSNAIAFLCAAALVAACGRRTVTD